MEVRGCFGGLELWGPLSSGAPVFLPPARARQKPAFLGAETLKILIKSSRLSGMERELGSAKKRARVKSGVRARLAFRPGNSSVSENFRVSERFVFFRY